MIINIVKLDGAQQREWTTTLSAFLWSCPFFAKISYDMMGPNEGEPVAIFTDSIGAPAAVDGSRMFFDPRIFFKYNLMQRVYIMAHEVAHCIMDHCGQGYEMHRMGYIALPNGQRIPYNHEEANISQDQVINAMLNDSGVGEWPGDGQLDPDVKGSDSWVDVFVKRSKKKPPQGGQKPDQGQPAPTSPGNQPGDGHGGFDKHLPPGTAAGKDPAEVKGERSPEQWKEAVQQAVAACEGQGNLPAGIKQFFDKMLERKYDWVEDLKTKVSRSIGTDAFTWDTLDPEFLIRRIGSPGSVGHGAGVVVCGVDTSGSIVADPKTLDMFMGVLANILEDANPERTLALWCDADVHREDDLTDPSDLNVVRAEGAGGGGGTDFRPVFDWVSDNFVEPDVLIYLTDMFGSFPDKDPGYPVIWATITKPGTVPFPFGQEVYVPRQV